MEGRVLGSGRESTGIPGVAVSDGLTVVLTDSRGRYALRVDPYRRHGALVYVTVPAGWQAAVDDACIPAFYRHVNLDEGPLDNVDFILRPDPAGKDEEYRFVALADVHVQAGGINTKETYSEQLKQIEKFAGEVTEELGPPRFVTVAGDVTNHASQPEFCDYLSASSASPVPVWSAPGNHDLVGREDGGSYPKPAPDIPYRDSIDGYRKALGPEWYSFQYGGNHFVVLENYWGLKEQDQLVWLERDLALHAVGKQVVVITHVPWNMPQTPGPAQTSAYLELLERYDVRLLLAGHTHANDVAANVIGEAVQAVTTSASHTLDQTPRGFRLVEFGASGIAVPFFELDADRSPTVVYPVGAVPWRASRVQVSRYSPPGLAAEVEFRVPPLPWRPLRQVGQRTWSGEIDVSSLPASMPQHLEVRARDRQDGEWTETSASFGMAAEAPATPHEGNPWTMFHGDARHSGLSADTVVPPVRSAWVRHSQGTILTSSLRWLTTRSSSAFATKMGGTETVSWQLTCRRGGLGGRRRPAAP